jgi:hypothetical protein
MPQITRLEAREAEIIAAVANRPSLEGHHLTDGVYCNTKAVIRRVHGGDVFPFKQATLLRFLIAHGMAYVLEEGRVSQVQTISADSDSIGTIDVWYKGRPVEIKVTLVSTRKDLMSQDHWLEQLGGYAYRNMGDRKVMRGELWSVHLLGDHGKKFCGTHGVPDEEFKRKHPDTNRARLACPECWEFLLDGQRETTLRCHEVCWQRDELLSLGRIQAWREEDLHRQEAEYRATGILPPPQWGFSFECEDCPAKEAFGCPGREDTADLEAELAGSIVELRARRQPSREIEFIP